MKKPTQIVQITPSDSDEQSVQAFAPPQGQFGTTQIVEESEMKGAIQELNSDVFDVQRKVSSIDMRSRLAGMEIAGLVQVDVLGALAFLPKDILVLSTQKKRLAISKDGKGREEIVSITSGIKEQEAQKKGGYFSNVGNALMGR